MTNLLALDRDSSHQDEDSSGRNADLAGDSPDAAALLLANVATIASNELNHRVLIKPMLFDPSIMSWERCSIEPGEITCACLHYDYGQKGIPPSLPTVSSDDDENQLPMETRDDALNDFCQQILSSSSSSSSTSALFERTHKASPNHACRKRTSSTDTRHLLRSTNGYLVQQPRMVRQVLAKKFSWKNYPELENYLISNRDEYLMHSSAHNYSAEQKKFNNKLTEGVLELATKHGYVFDHFSFVMLRDKIRCYYKSYLQTLRKKQREGAGMDDRETA